MARCRARSAVRRVVPGCHSSRSSCARGCEGSAAHRPERSTPRGWPNTCRRNGRNAPQRGSRRRERVHTRDEQVGKPRWCDESMTHAHVSPVLRSLAVGRLYGWGVLLLVLNPPRVGWVAPRHQASPSLERHAVGGGRRAGSGAGAGGSAGYRRHHPRAGAGCSCWCWVRGFQSIPPVLLGTASPYGGFVAGSWQRYGGPILI